MLHNTKFNSIRIHWLYKDAGYKFKFNSPPVLTVILTALADPLELHSKLVWTCDALAIATACSFSETIVLFSEDGLVGVLNICPKHLPISLETLTYLEVLIHPISLPNLHLD